MEAGQPRREGYLIPGCTVDVGLDGIDIANESHMFDEVPGPDLEARVAQLLEVAEPDWTCRVCIARTLDLSQREVKIALLRLGRFRDKDYTETACDVCTDCGAETAVVRLGRRGHLRRAA